MTNPAVEAVQARVDALTGRLMAALCMAEVAIVGREGLRSARKELCRATRHLLFGDLDDAERMLRCVESVLAGEEAQDA